MREINEKSIQQVLADEVERLRKENKILRRQLRIYERNSAFISNIKELNVNP
jgi:hypothetical protein